MSRSKTASRLRKFIVPMVVTLAMPAAISTTQSSAGTCAVNHLFEWSGPNYTGTQMVVGPYNIWFNYAAGNEATTTSFMTGNGDAIFAGHRDGGGARYPATPGYCASVPTLVGTGWNDRFRSRKRIP
jgi:hypothetical protein